MSENEMALPHAPRRIFLSMLGTNPYAAVEYEPIAEDEPRTPIQKFIQISRLLALEARLDARGHSLDEAYIFVTADARKRNWDDRGQRERDERPMVDKHYGTPEWVGLASTAKRENVRTPLTPVEIDNGATLDQLWKTFTKVASFVHDGDELYVDVTHGFRTLPLVLLWTLDYVRRVKNAHIAEVSYGAYEALPSADSSPRPTWDLRPFLDIRDWTDAYQQLADRGDFEPFGVQGSHFAREFVSRSVAPIPPDRSPDEKQRIGKENTEKRRIAKQELDATGLPQAAAALRALGDHLERVRLHRIPDAAWEACQALRLAASHTGNAPRGAYLEPLKLVLERVHDTIAPMAADPGATDAARIHKELTAARFLLGHGRHMQSFTLYREAMIDLLGLISGLDLARHEVDGLSGALTAAARGKQVRETGWNETQRHAFRRLLRRPEAEAARAVLEVLQQPRNALDHAHTGEFLETKHLEAAGRKIEKRVHQLPTEIAKGGDSAPPPRVPRLFNVSNHALTEPQRSEAESRFHVEDLVDLPPDLATLWSSVPPDTEDLHDFIAPIESWLGEHAAVGDCILLQGEPGATVLLASRLANTGPQLLHATSERVVTEHEKPDGTVETRREFRHVRFRHYQMG